MFITKTTERLSPIAGRKPKYIFSQLQVGHQLNFPDQSPADKVRIRMAAFAFALRQEPKWKFATASDGTTFIVYRIS